MSRHVFTSPAGVTWTVGDAQVRALLPGPVDDVPRVVSRLQIGGTDLPHGLSNGTPGGPLPEEFPRQTGEPDPAHRG